MELGIRGRRAIVARNEAELSRTAHTSYSVKMPIDVAGYFTGQNVLLDGGLYPGTF